MNTINRILTNEEIQMLKEILNKELIKFKHEQMIYINSVYKDLFFEIDKSFFDIRNNFEVINYFGDKEEVSFISLIPVKEKDVKSELKDTPMITTNVSEIIKSIEIVNEKQKYSSSKGEDYELLFTRAIVFNTETQKYILEKDIWLSERIIFERGNEYYKTLIADYEHSDNDSFDDGPITIERNIVTIE